jgi:hypothetical protein
MDLVRWWIYFLAGVGSGLLDLRRLFKVVLVYYTTLKSTGESVRIASLKGVTGLEDVEDGLCGCGDDDDVTRWRTFVGRNG